MRKTLLAALVAFVFTTLAYAGSGQGHTVGTSSVMILPPRGQSTANAWATPVTYAQGAIVSHGGHLFWCQTAGGANDATDAPVLEADGRSSVGANTWQYIPRGDRELGVIVNNDDAPIYLNDATAVANAGIRLNAAGGVWNIPSGLLNSPVYAICGSASKSVTTFDR